MEKIRTFSQRFMRNLVTGLARNKTNILAIVIISFLSLVPLKWFRDGYTLTGKDFAIPINPTNFLLRYGLSTWYSYVQMGFDSSYGVLNRLPLWSIFAGLDSLGFSLFNNEITKILFIGIFLLQGFSMYYLTSTLVNDKKYRIGYIVSAIFYMFNPYIMVKWQNGNIETILTYSTIPMIFAFFIKGTENKKKSWKYAILIGLLSALFIFFSPTFVALLLPFCLLFIFAMVINKTDKIHVNISFFCKTLLMYSLFNLWWILPSMNLLTTVSSERVVGIAKAPSEAWLESHRLATPLNSFRLLGHFLWGARVAGTDIPFFNFEPMYSTNPILMFVTFLIPLQAFAALLLARSMGRRIFGWTVCFSLLSIISLFLGKGVAEPFSIVNKWFYDNIPYFWIFREPWSHFIGFSALSYAFLIGITASQIHHYLGKKCATNISLIKVKSPKRLMPLFGVFLTISSLLIASWPMLTGDVMEHQENNTIHVQIPSYYWDAQEWLKKQSSDFRVFVLPYSTIYEGYEWGYEGPTFVQRLLDHPSVAGQAGSLGPQSEDLLRYINLDLLQQGKWFRDFVVRYGTKPFDLSKILGLISAKYVLLQTDFLNYNNITKELIESQNGLYLERTFGKLLFYRNTNYVPILYATDNIIFIEGNIETLGPLGLIDESMQRSAIFFSNLLRPDERSWILNISNTIFIQAQETTLGSYLITVPKARNYTIYGENFPSFAKINLTEGWTPVHYHEGPYGNVTIKDGMLFFPKNPKRYIYEKSVQLDAQNHKYLAVKFQGNGTLSIWVWWSDKADNIHRTNVLWQEQASSNWRHTVINLYQALAHHMKKEPNEIISIELSPESNSEILISQMLWSNTSTSLLALNETYFENGVYEIKASPETLNLHLYSTESISQSPFNTLEYRKTSETSYHATIKVTKPHFLVFSSQYHPQWEAYVNGHRVLKHILVNAYANAWYIDKTAEYTVEISYWPQKLFYTGSTISLATLFISIIYVCAHKRIGLFHKFVKKKLKEI